MAQAGRSVVTTLGRKADNDYIEIASGAVADALLQLDSSGNVPAGVFSSSLAKQSPAGGAMTFGVSEEEITLSTSGLTTDSTANLLPANSLILGVTGVVTESLTGGENAQGTITLTGVPSIGVAAQGTMTLTGLPSAGVKSQGTITVGGVPNVAVRSQGTITLTGVPSIGVEAQGTMTIAGVPNIAVQAVGTITMSGTGIAIADETFVVDTQTFTWKASRSGAGEVTIGSDKPTAVANIVAAITADLATVTAAADGDTVVVTAVTAGTAGNSIVFTESSTNMAVDGTGTLGGTTAGAAAGTFVIDSQTFTFVTSRAGVGEVTAGASAAAAVTNIVAAVNLDLASVVASDGDGDTVVITAASKGVAGNSIVFTEDATNVTVDGAGTLGTTRLGVAVGTFVVGSQTFTWKASRATTGEVAAGASAADCTENIVTAITADLDTVTAVLGAGETVVVTAVAAGTAGNSLTFTEASTNMTVDGSGTLGGTTAGAAAGTFVVDDQTFTFVTTRAGTGEVTAGASASAAVTNIVAAITADLSSVTAADGDGDTVVVTAATVGTAGDSIVLTENATNITVDGAGTLGATTAGANADTFTIDDQVFTFVTTRGTTGQVTLGANAPACVTNIVTAVNLDLDTVSAADGDGDTVVVTAASLGTAGNSIVFTENATNLTVDGAGTLGATTTGVAVGTFQIDDQVFTWKAARTVAGDVAAGVSAAACVTNIVTAITADLTTVTAADGDGDTVVVTCATGGTGGNSIVFTESSTNMTMDGAGVLGGTTAGSGCGGWALGDPTTATRFASNQATLVAGTTSIGLNHLKGGVSTDATGPVQGSAAKLRVTATTSAPDSGKVRATVYYLTYAAPTA